MKLMTSGKIKSLQKAIDVINYLAENGEMGVTELSRHFQVSKSNIYNILNTLVDNRWVKKNEKNSKYKLGLRLYELGNVVRDDMKLREIAAPYMEKLVEIVGETVHLTVMEEGMVVYIETATPNNKFSVSILSDHRVYMHCTGVGKAILAYLEEDKIDEIIEEKGLPRFTPNTIRDPQELKEHLKLIKERGYSVDDVEHEPGVRCVGAPIFNEKGKAFASMSITGPSPRFTEDKIREYANLLKDITENISRKLGWQGEKN